MASESALKKIAEDQASDAARHGGQQSPEQSPEQWVDRYSDALFRFAIVKVNDDVLAEELVQETFLAAIAGRGKFRSESTVSTWLFAILKRKIADHFRRRRRDVGQSEEQSPNHTVVRRNDTARQWSDDPAAIHEYKEFWKTFDECVEKLPNKLSEVFILREVNQQTPKEICELLGVGATNLSMRLHRCRLALRDCLNRNWFDETS